MNGWMRYLVGVVTGGTLAPVSKPRTYGAFSQRNVEELPPKSRRTKADIRLVVVQRALPTKPQSWR